MRGPWLDRCNPTRMFSVRLLDFAAMCTSWRRSPARQTEALTGLSLTDPKRPSSPRLNIFTDELREPSPLALPQIDGFGKAFQCPVHARMTLQQSTPSPNRFLLHLKRPWLYPESVLLPLAHALVRCDSFFKATAKPVEIVALCGPSTNPVKPSALTITVSCVTRAADILNEPE